MASVINDRDVLLQAASTRLIAVDLPPLINIPANATLNNVPVQVVIDNAAGGDITTDILSNSATAITVTSSNLFTYPGTSQAGVFVGSGGIQGRNPSGDVTFSLASLDGDAEFEGTIKAGSVLTSSITLSGSGRTLSLIDAGATGYTNTQLQSDLDAGVGNVLAGVGGNYTMTIDKDNSLIVLSHKDAVYNGVAATGSNKPALGISSAGIGMGYNRSSDGQWVNSVTINASGQAAFSGTVSANSFISVDAIIPGTGFTIQDFVDKTNEVATGDNTVAILENSGTTINVSSSTLFQTSAGNGGVFIGGGGLFGRDLTGATTFSIDGASGAVSVVGNILGGSNLSIHGQARFRGNSTVSSVAAACHVNESRTSPNGIVAFSDNSVAVQGVGSLNAAGVFGTAQGSGTDAIRGLHTGSGNGIKGVAALSTGYGVFCQGRSRVTGDLHVDGTISGGSFTATHANTADNATTADSATFATTAGSANSVDASNITGSIDADTIGSFNSNQIARSHPCNTGTAIVSGGQSDIEVIGPLFDTVRTRGDGNRVYIENKPSDAVTKTGIQPQPLGYDFLNAIDPVIFQRVNEPGRFINGFTANRIAAVIGRSDNPITAWNENGCMTMDQISLISPLVKGFQQMSKRLEEAQATIASLKYEVDLLKSKEQ
ncbi:hypothetical protein [uncultured Paraglaciecola sp.]|uniref:hypothetical protein n=1 Tax=uncultured Paraglaciecola sp. TaxID=1765024 RepID=UPI002622D71D|nr:hypothetical protein [uncultured Paraglaciecola sp.]